MRAHQNMLKTILRIANGRNTEFNTQKQVENAYRIVSTPEDTHGLAHACTKVFIGRPFSVRYDFELGQTELRCFGIDSERIDHLQNEWPGLAIEIKDHAASMDLEKPFRLDGFPFQQEHWVKDPQNTTEPMENSAKKSFEKTLDAFCGKKCRLVAGFEPVPLEELETHRQELEAILRTHTTSRQTPMNPGWLSEGTAMTTTSNARHTDRTRMAAEIVTMINEAKTQNDAAYRVSIYGAGPDAPLLKNVLKTAYVNFEQNIDEWEKAKKSRPLSNGEMMSARYASQFIQFIPSHVQKVPSMRLASLNQKPMEGGIPIGTELRHGVAPTLKSVELHPDALMLHALVSGLNGMGKTTLAHGIASSLVKKGMPVIVFSPDKEWNGLARSNPNLPVLPLHDSIPINLARCPEGVSTDAFYQNLALWLSKAMNAGPYEQPLMKTMLAAFTDLYGNGKKPTLEQLYDAIVEATDRMYGTLTARGYKYDQYGHNIKSALESIRQILLKPQYQTTEGICIEDSIRHGGVFDTSELSELFKPLFYAFLFSQIFSFALKHFDEHARHLRVLIVIEEAHLVFKNNSPDEQAVLSNDLENKMGLLRKRGIGLLFITHFSDQLHPTIRRYTQNKIAFRQDAQSLDATMDDLGFEPNDVPLRNTAKGRMIKMAPFEAAVRLSGPDYHTIGPAFIKTKTEFIEPLSELELRSKVEGLKKIHMPPMESNDQPTDIHLQVNFENSAMPEKQSPVSFMRSEIVPEFIGTQSEVETLRAIGNGSAQTASDLVKIRAIGKAYKKAIDALSEQGLIFKKSRQSRTKSATVFRLTEKGKKAYRLHTGMNPKQVPEPLPSRHHEAALEEITEHFENYRMTVLRRNFVKTKECHLHLGIKPFLAQDRIDLVLEKKAGKTRTVLLFEYEVGTNHDAQMFTNLTKLVQTQSGLTVAHAGNISNISETFQINAYWVAKNRKVKDRLLDLAVRYQEATGERVRCIICTLEELLKNTAFQEKQ